MNRDKVLPRRSNSQRTRRRYGLSIMEVLFAIGVLTIGLLGIASILPVATNNASTALRTDRAVEEINNRVAEDLAELSSSFETVVVSNNSQATFNGAIVSFLHNQRLGEVSTSRFGTYLQQYDRVLAAGAADQPQMPDAFCIDPWFLSAAGALRDDINPNFYNNRNGYDRTLFPCYDPRINPILDPPNEALSNALGPGDTKIVDLPRFTRIAFPFNNQALVAAMNAEAEARRSDDFSVNVNEDDSTLGPGLFVQRARNGGPPTFPIPRSQSLAKSTVSSDFSSFVLMSRSAPGSNVFDAAVVTTLKRNVLNVDGGYFDGNLVPPTAGAIPAHNLRPYAAWLPDDPANPNSFATEDTQLYDGEMIGYVSAAPRPIAGGGGGEFEFRTNRYVKPAIQAGNWLMLMRREYSLERSQGYPVTARIVPGALKFAWYRVTDVMIRPTLVTRSGVDLYETQVTVNGPDWVFHPTQVQMFGNQYAPPYYRPTAANPALAWTNPPFFDVDNLPARGTNPAGYAHFDYGTTVVLMPSVISVRQFQVQL